MFTSRSIEMIISIIGVIIIIGGFYFIIDQWHKKLIILRNNLNEQILKDKKIVHNIELGLFEAKEHGLWLHDHYRDMMFIISNIGWDDPDQANQALNRAMTATRIGLDIVSNNFRNTFGCTPEEYRKSKVGLQVTTKDGGKYIHPNFGIN